MTSVPANPAYQAGGPHQMIEGPRPGGGGLGAEWDAQLASGGMRRPAGSLQLPPPLPVPDSNQRDWPRAWQLAGGKSRDYGTAAYRQWVGGYSCTVRDHVTTITAKGNSCWSSCGRWRPAVLPRTTSSATSSAAASSPTPACSATPATPRKDAAAEQRLGLTIRPSSHHRGGHQTAAPRSPQGARPMRTALRARTPAIPARSNRQPFIRCLLPDAARHLDQAKYPPIWTTARCSSAPQLRLQSR